MQLPNYWLIPKFGIRRAKMMVLDEAKTYVKATGSIVAHSVYTGGWPPTCPICKTLIVFSRDVYMYDSEARQYFHNTCKSGAAELDRLKKMYLPDEEEADDRVVFGTLKGNLPEAEYRFWIGTAQGLALTGKAVCRACKNVCFTAQERVEHKADKRWAIDGDNCCVRLTAAYKLILQSKFCLVCEGTRNGYAKWGVPLCEKAECQTKWKFRVTPWPALEEAIYKTDNALRARANTRMVRAL